MRKLCTAIICSFISVYAFPQCIVSGEVTDHTGRRISGAAVVIMNAADSVSIAWDYTQDEPFHIQYTNPNNNKLLLYIEAIGYESIYRNLPENATHCDLGRLELAHSNIQIEEITITAEAPIKYKFVAGKNEFEIPRSIGEQVFDLNMLLMHIPGLAVDGDKVTVIGRGTPEFTINGQKPRPGELEQLAPKDIARISIDRMPSARYSKEVKSVVDIVTRKVLRDQVNVRVVNDFRMGHEPRNGSAVAIDSRFGKWTNYASYMYDYGRTYYETVYATTLHSDKQSYERIYSQKPLFTSHAHAFTLSPKFQINDKSFIDLQYHYKRKSSDGSHPEIFDIVGYERSESTGSSRTDNDTHNLILRYFYETEGRNRLDLNCGYSSVGEKGHNIISEWITSSQSVPELITTDYTDRFVSETVSFTANYEHTFGRDITADMGLELAEIWNHGKTIYKGSDPLISNTEETQAALYANYGQQIGKFRYRLGLRGEYLYKYRAENKDVNANPFSWLPSVSLSYEPTDAINLNFYFRRSTVHPTISERDPILHYVNKYEYMRGNPDLKSYIENEIALRLELPYHFSVALEYDFAKNPIIMMDDIYNIEKQQTILTYHNFPEKKNLIANISWYRRFGFYTLYLDATYDQNWSKTPFGDGYLSLHKPMFGMRIQQTVKIAKCAEFNVAFNYQTSYDALYTHNSESYNIDINLALAFFQRRLNIVIACYNIFYTDQRTKEMYKNISTENWNRMFDRQFRVGISYKFNSLKSDYRRNDSNANILNRLQ